MAALEADDRLLGQSLLGLPGDPLPGLRVLTGIRWRWQLEQTKTSVGGFPGLSDPNERPLVTIEVRCRLAPIPKDLAPEPGAADPPTGAPMPVRVELPAWWLPPTAGALARWAPGSRSRPDNTLLMDLEGGILAVRNPQRLLGWPLHAKLWLDGTRLRRRNGGWPAAPFFAWVSRVGQWLADPSTTVSRPVAGDPDDALPQAARAVSEAHRRLEATLAGTPSRVGLELPGLEARRTLADFEAELALRVDMAGELSNEGDKATLTLRSLLEIERVGGAEQLCWRLLPPAVLASHKQLMDLLAALETDRQRSPWSRLSGFHSRLLEARDDPATLAFRTRGSRRWVVMLPFRFRSGGEPDYAILRANFELATESAGGGDGESAGTTTVRGDRRVLRWPAPGVPVLLEDDTLRGLLRLMTALHRFGMAAT